MANCREGECIATRRSIGRAVAAAGDTAHLGLPTRAPPRSPAQRFDLFSCAEYLAACCEDEGVENPP